jgi:carotenoid cleavage dioxygenase
MVDGDAPGANLIVDDEVLACGETGPMWRIDLASLQAAARPLTGGRSVTIPHAHPDGSGRLVVTAFDWPEQIITAWSWADDKWELRRSVQVPDRNYVHDALVVDDLLVLGLHPLLRTPRGMGWDSQRASSTWAIAHLDSSDPVVLLDSAPCFVWHSGWAAVDGVLTMRAPVRPTPGMFEQERILDTSVVAGIREWTLDAERAAVSERQITDTPCDFPVPLGESLVVGVAGEFQDAPDYTRCSGVAIVEPDGTQHMRKHPQGWFGGEFRPATTDVGTVLMGLISGPDSSRLLILDPADVSAEPVATVEIPVTIPAGLHSAWVPA